MQKMIFNRVLFAALLKREQYTMMDVSARTGICYRRIVNIANNTVEASISEVNELCKLLYVGYHSLWWEPEDFQNATMNELMVERDY